MIRIRIERNDHGDVKRVLVTGHANFAEHGSDIVCAAVSGIVFGQVNAIETLTGVRVHQPDDGDGKVDLRIPEGLAPEVERKIILLVEAMVISLRDIADSYPRYVRWINK
ncbi:ribosomal-processing cysteine protease Prp [Thermoactinomyces sp. DSM 45892]|uniref:ribosomal-processing cysteine protease Prp n=1 Tax=Thermoactinomyces sp. DSM 45892 TaxID=1882753 RepID=UPI00089671FE|nr:ribosomal-processing cysteine protease Prp [Thermoactinomyces sp. DSM 45892]SDY05110.1 hypothetical protein SAMN05444416_101338 [Thermoactinomyces sp. DSM 45892]